MIRVDQPNAQKQKKSSAPGIRHKNLSFFFRNKQHFASLESDIVHKAQWQKYVLRQKKWQILLLMDDIHFSDLVSDGGQSSYNTSDNDWGSGDGSSSEELSLDEATVHKANEPNNDIDDSATDTTTYYQ